MKAFSPTRTIRWAQCPLKQSLYEQGWRTRRLSQRDWSAALSVGVHAGLASLYRYRMEGAAPDVEAAVGLGVGTAATRLAAWDALGYETADRDRAQREAIPRRVRALLEHVAQEDPIPKDWGIFGVEQEYPEHGYARPDLEVADGRGPAPLDWKVRISPSKGWNERETARWATSHNMYHYSWILGADRYYVVTLIAEPYGVEWQAVDIPPDAMARWEQSAKETWRRMADPFPAAASLIHLDEYGPCEYFKACFLLGLDPEKMRAQGYLQEDRP